VSVMSVLHTGQRAHPVAVEVVFWRHVQHKQCPRGIMATSQITISHTGQVVDCGEDWDVEATGCDLGIVFAAALLRAGRLRRRRGVTVVNAGVGPDPSAGISPRFYSVLASSSSSDPPATIPAVESSASYISRLFA